MRLASTYATVVRRLQGAVPSPVAAMLDALRAAKGRPVVVGGAVRDAVFGQRPHDWDVAVQLTPRRLFEVARGLGCCVKPIGKTNPSYLWLGGVDRIDIALWPRRPRFAAVMLADLQRRDATINAMAACLFERQIWDPFGGLEDARNRLLRVPNDQVTARFTQDPLRLLRALRFVAQMGLRLHPNVQAALAPLAKMMAQCAAERRRAELWRLIMGPHVDVALQTLWTTGMQAYVAPGLGPAPPNLGALPHRAEVRLAGWAWVSSDSRRRCAAVMAALRCSRAQQRMADAVLLTAEALDPAAAPTAAARRRLAAQVPPEAALSAARLAAWRWPQRYHRLPALLRRDYRTATLQVRDLRLSTAALKSLGFAGPQLGRMQSYLLEAVLQRPGLNSSEALGKLARQVRLGGVDNV